MFKCLPNETIDVLSRDRRLPLVLSRYLEPSTAPQLTDCEHTFVCHIGGLCTCGVEATLKCTQCDALNCSKCYAAYKAKLYDEQDMLELITTMKSGWGC